MYKKGMYELVFARFRVQYGQCFPSFSYFADLLKAIEENIGYIVRNKRATTTLSLT